MSLAHCALSVGEQQLVDHLDVTSGPDARRPVLVSSSLQSIRSSQKPEAGTCGNQDPGGLLCLGNVGLVPGLAAPPC